MLRKFVTRILLSFIRILPSARCEYTKTRKPDGNHAAGGAFIVSGLGQKTKGETAESRSERRLVGDRRNVVQRIRSSSHNVPAF
jgi:hypothetical protein